MPIPPTTTWQPSFTDGKVSLEASSTDKVPEQGSLQVNEVTLALVESGPTLGTQQGALF